MKITKWIKDKILSQIDLSFVFVVLFVLSAVNNTILKQKVSDLNDDLDNKINNIEAYEGMLNDAYTSNNVLRLNMSTLSASNDNLLNKLDSVRKELKISDKALRTAVAQKNTIVVSEKDTITINDSCEFKKTFKPNDLTMLKIELKQDSLQYELKIENDVFLYIYGDKDWRNKNKKFFKRLFTWDWKKTIYYKYEVVNTNPLIQVGKTRIIENIDNK